MVIIIVLPISELNENWISQLALQQLSEEIMTMMKEIEKTDMVIIILLPVSELSEKWIYELALQLSEDIMMMVSEIDKNIYCFIVVVLY